MGSNNGTGQPYWFRCSKCRSFVSGAARDDGWERGVTLTGRRRKHRGRQGSRVTGIDREYRCDACGHVGWSAHIDLCIKMGDHRYLQIENGETYLPSYARVTDS